MVHTEETCMLNSSYTLAITSCLKSSWSAAAAVTDEEADNSQVIAGILLGNFFAAAAGAVE
jgi:hypothetical protein